MGLCERDLLAERRANGKLSGPGVGLGEIAIDVSEARFWTAKQNAEGSGITSA